MKRTYILGIVVLCIVIVAAVAGYVLWSQPGVVQSVKDTLVIAQPQGWTNWDPSVEISFISASEQTNIFETLTRWDYTGGLHSVPCLATSWSRINETAFEFKLRQGVNFSSGREFTAWDVKFTLEKMLNPQQPAPWRYFVTPNKYFEVVDNYTIRIGADVPYALTAFYLSGFSVGIQDRVAYNGTTIATQGTPSGTGPYMLGELKKGEYVTLERFDGYWNGTSASRIKTIKIKFIPDITTRVIALESGEVDYVHNVSPGDMARLPLEGFNTTQVTSLRIHYLELNTVKPPLSDLRVRQAINYAINRTEIASNLYAGLALPADSLVSPYAQGYSPVFPVEYNVTKAKALLAEAGYSNGFAITMFTPNGQYLLDKEQMLAIAAYLGKIGITVNLQVYDWAAYRAAQTAQSKMLIPTVDITFDSVSGRNEWHAFTSDFARPLAYNGTGMYNTMGWYDTELESLCTQFQSANESDQQSILIAMQAIDIRDMALLPTIVQCHLEAYVPELKGVYLGMLEEYYFWDAYFVSKASTTASLSLGGSSVMMAAMLPLLNALTSLPKRRNILEKHENN